MGYGSNPGAVQAPTQMQPRMAQPTGPNVFQQSANALTQAQNAAGGLSRFQPRQMQAAQLGPASRMGAVGQVGNVNSVGRVGPMGYAGQVRDVNAVGQVQPMGFAGQVGNVNSVGQVGRIGSVGQVGDINAPRQIGVNQLQNLNVGAYMNPYIDQVINRGQSDIERQRQMASNALGAEATAAGAFGGSRQAVQEGILAGEAARAAGDLSAQQRQAGFNQALQSGQFDIGNIQNARTLASQQGFQASTLNQQAAEMAAAREQAVRGLNQQAAETAASREQQARLVNQQAAEAAAARSQASMGANLQSREATAAREQAARMSNQQAAEAAASRLQSVYGMDRQSAEAAAAREQQARLVNQQAAEAAAGRLQGAYGTNAAAQNQFALQQAALQQQANQANFGGQFDAAGIRQGAAGLLGNLAQTGYGFGTGLAGQQAQQGAMMQGMNQSLIDAARNQYGGFTGAPANSLQAMLAAVGAGDMGQQTTTQTQQPGLLGYLSALSGIAGGFR